ncbi:MAG: M48 family metallopeptidase [Anaerolineae bacterium]
MTPPIKIYRQHRRTMMMRPMPGMLEVYIPHQLHEDDPRVQDFIAQGLKELRDEVPDVPPTLTPRSQIEAMVQDYATRLNVTANRVQFRQMRHKWGSCSNRGTVTLNTRLSWLSPDLVAYIVCHELAHLIEFNHSEAFWALMAHHMPDYQARLQELRRVERNMVAW